LTRLGDQVCVGLAGQGYVELTLEETRAIAEELYRLSDVRLRPS
jgi:hypothetical protein